MGGSQHVIDFEKYKIKFGEVFKVHPFFEKYKVSNYGRVMLPKSNFSKRLPGVITIGHRHRRCGKGGKFEQLLHMRSNGKDYTKRISRLVAETWLPLPTVETSRLVVDHVDENSENNRIENLQWMTTGDNLRKYHKSRK